LSPQDSYALFRQLSDLADGPGNVHPYCQQVLQRSDAGSTNQGNQGSRGMDGHAGHNGNGNGPGRSDSGSGGQNQQ